MKQIPILLLCIFTSCMGQEKKMLKYVSLGDSYTIGTGAKPEEAWPNILTKHLNENKIKVALSENPARNGFTTENLIDYELPIFDKVKPDFVTLLIGVNDWVRGVDTNSYHKNLIYILDHLEKNLSDKKKILLVTIPDFGVTPQGQLYSHGRDISKGITEFNNILKQEAKKRNLLVADIFEQSKKMKDDKNLVAEDGLHPSAKEYAEWEKIILPVALKMLQ